MSVCDPNHDPEFAALTQTLLDRLETNDDPAAPYEPYLHAVHSRSHGYVQRVPGTLTPRLYDLLSRIELGALLLLEWRTREYKNIREQFALPIDLTLAIAARVGIKHPTFQGKPATMSVDFILTKHDGSWEAVDVKQSIELSKRRCREKLDLAALTVSEVGVPHRVMTEDEMPEIEVRNLRFLRTFATPYDPAPLDEHELSRLEPNLRGILSSGTITIANAASQVSHSLGIDRIRAIRASFWFIANHRWAVDVTVPIGPDYPVKFAG